MATFLTNSKMGPALQARIEMSVRGRSAAPSRITPTVRMALRLLVLVAVVGGVGVFASQWRRSRGDLQSARIELVHEVGLALAGLEPPDESSSSLAQEWLAQAAAEYEGDYVDPSLRDPAALDALVERRAVYIRGPVGAFAADAPLEKAAADSVKDAFVHCLVDPPSSRGEKALLPKVVAAFRGAAPAESETAHIRRLHEAFVAQRFAADSWVDRVRSARSVRQIDELREGVEQAHLEQAVDAARAEILIYLLDEAKEAGTATELDGASEHFIRVGIVDLSSSQAVLRMRQRVDPSWISEAKRVYLARGLNSCRLAFDVRQKLQAEQAD